MWPAFIRSEGRFLCFPSSGPAKIRTRRPISRPEALLRNRKYMFVGLTGSRRFWVSGRSRRPQNHCQKVGREAPYLLEVFSRPPGPPRPQNRRFPVGPLKHALKTLVCVRHAVVPKPSPISERKHTLGRTYGRILYFGFCALQSVYKANFP